MLSSSETKASVWRVYTATCKASGEQAVCYSKFVDFWHQFCPKVVVAKPMTDLCLTCQQNTTKLVRAANLLEHEKADSIKAQQEHLDCAQVEREFYRKNLFRCSHDFQSNRCGDESKRNARTVFIQWHYALLLRLCTTSALSK